MEKRAVENVRLSRYARYLIVQNADSGKEVVALGQTYFAVKNTFSRSGRWTITIACIRKIKKDNSRVWR